MPEVGALLLQLETELLQPGARRNADRLACLLAEEFCEYGSSGRVYTLQQTIDALLAEEPGSCEITGCSVAMVAEDVALVRYRATRGGVASLRTSLWVLRDRRWQLLFHQGTRTAE